jgi:hypothetical protein
MNLNPYAAPQQTPADAKGDPAEVFQQLVDRTAKADGVDKGAAIKLVTERYPDAHNNYKAHLQKQHDLKRRGLLPQQLAEQKRQQKARNETAARGGIRRLT